MKTWFHIGFPKAGSSFLQKGLFAKHSDISFMGRIPINNTGLGSNIEDHPYLHDSELLDLHNKLISNHFTKKDITKFQEKISHYSDKSKVTMLSSEFMTSIFFALPDFHVKIERIKKIGVVGVLIVIRNQAELIKSQYREHPFHPSDLVHGKPVNIDDWIIASENQDLRYLESLKYDKLINTCSKVFGNSNVHVITFHELISDYNSIATKFERWFGINKGETLELLESAQIENLGVSARYNMIRNFKKKLIGEFPISNYLPNKLLESLKNSFKKGKKEEYELNPKTIQYLNNYFRESNSNLDEIPVEKLRYPPYYTEE